MHKNIILAYILASIRFSWFWLGIWIFFYLRFTNYAGVGLAESVMIITAILLDIPTGVLADLFGKKTILFFAFLFQGLGNIVMGLTPNYPILLLGIFIATFGGAFYSGVIDALIFDTLKQYRQENMFGKIMANTKSFQFIVGAMAGIIGGFLYTISPSLPFIATGVIYFVGTILTLFLTEPIVEKAKLESLKFIEHTQQGFKLLFSANVRHLTLVLFCVGITFIISREMLDDLLAVEFGFKATQLAILWSAVFLGSAVVVQMAPKFHKKFNGYKGLLIVAMIASLMFMVSPFVGIFFGGMSLVIRIFSESFFENISSVMINEKIESSYRTTTLSTFNMLKNIPYAFAAFFIGSMMDIIKARNFAFILGAFLLVFVVINLLIFVKNRKLSPRPCKNINFAVNSG